MKNKIELIDFLRGFSIFTIVAMHLCQHHTEGALNKAFSIYNFLQGFRWKIYNFLHNIVIRNCNFLQEKPLFY